MVKAKSEPIWPHLRHATLSDVRDELSGVFGAWAIVSGLSLGIGWVGDRVPPHTPLKNPVPDWVMTAIIAAMVLWTIRGATINYRVPRLTLTALGGLGLLVGMMQLLVERAPLWVSLPILWGIWLIGALLDRLDAKGRANFEALEAARGGLQGAS